MKCNDVTTNHIPQPDTRLVEEYFEWQKVYEFTSRLLSRDDIMFREALSRMKSYQFSLKMVYCTVFQRMLAEEKLR